MSSKRVKLVGKINESITSFYSLEKYNNYKIYQSLNLIYHVNKHKVSFINSYSYYYTLNNLEEVLLSPEFVYYDNKNNSFRYFKKLKEYVCVIVKFNDGSAFISTFYPVSKKKF